jgi:hypothetical protein
MAGIDAFVVPVVLLVTLYLFYRLVTSIAHDFLGECVIPGLGWEYRRVLRQHTTDHVAKDWEDTESRLSTLSDLIVAQAKHDPPDLFRQSLRLCEELRKIWLAFEMPSLRVPLFCPTGLGKAAVDSGNEEKIEALFDFAYEGIRASLEARSATSFSKVSDVARDAYRAGAHSKDETISQTVGSLTTLKVVRPVLTWHTYRPSPQLQPEFPRLETPQLIWALGLTTNLTTVALSAGRTEDARRFLESLCESRRHEQRQLEEHRSEMSLSREIQVAHELRVYAETVIAIWFLHLAKEHGSLDEKVATLNRDYTPQLGTCEEILCVWEAVRRHHPRIDEELGVTFWPLPESQLKDKDPDARQESWVVEGLVGLMLELPRAQAEPGAKRPGEPPSRPYDLPQIKEAADAWLSDDYVRTEVLAIDDNQRDEALRQVLELFSGRNRVFEAERLRRVVSGQEANERGEAMVQQIRNRVGEIRKHVYAWGDLPKAAEGMERGTGARIMVGRHIPKEYLMADGPDVGPWSEQIAQDLARQEALETASAVQSATMTVEQLSDVGELRDAVLRAVGTLASRGYRPSRILVPGQAEVAKALFESIEDPTPEPDAFGPDHIGRWRECQVFRWPDGAEASCVVVMDPAALYTCYKATDEPPLMLDVQEPNADVHRQWLAELDEAKESVHTADEVSVIVVARMPVAAGVRDPEAAVRIDLPPVNPKGQLDPTR